MLRHILEQEPYSLALTPGFFRYYAHTGVLHALEEYECLNVSHICGSSAGALVGAFLASGLKPSEMLEPLFSMKRSDIWDVGGIGGLLKGHAAKKLLEQHLLVKKIEDCPIPLGVTAFDMLRLRTNCITKGCLATTAIASCTFPGLFQPVMIDGSPHIDGGVWDHCGLLALEECHKSAKLRNNTATAVSLPKAEEKKEETGGNNPIVSNQLVVNVVFDTERGSVLPPKLQNHRLLTIVMENIPGVTPFDMSTKGVDAYNVCRAAMRKALANGAHIQERAPNHWICYIDGKKVKADEIAALSIPIQLPVKALKGGSTTTTPRNNNNKGSSSSSSAANLLLFTEEPPQSEDTVTESIAAETEGDAVEDLLEEEAAMSESTTSSNTEEIHSINTASIVNNINAILNNSNDSLLPTDHEDIVDEKKAVEAANEEEEEEEEHLEIASFSFINGSYKFSKAMLQAMTNSSWSNKEEEKVISPTSSSSLKRKFDQSEPTAAVIASEEEDKKIAKYN